MGYAIPKEITLEVEECCSCGVSFALPAFLQSQRREDGGRFYCPNGHSMVYGKGEVGRLREKFDEQTRVATAMAERARLAESARAEAEARAAKAAAELKRHQKRTKAGVCPCCHRSFAALARHMATKHPDFSQ